MLTIDLGTGQVLNALDLPGITTGVCSFLALSPNGSSIYVTMSGTLYAIDSRTMTIANSVPLAAPGFGLALTPDGQYLYATNASSPGGVSIFSTSSLQVTGTIPSPVGLGQVLLIGK